MDNEIDNYFLPAGEMESLTAEAVDAYKRHAYGSFNSFCNEYFQLWMVTIARDKSKFSESKCSCPAFNKKYICKHILGLGLRMKKVEMPASNILIVNGRLRCKGRARKIGPALSKE